jgi:DNA-binding transcriptional ArsR family regulator
MSTAEVATSGPAPARETEVHEMLTLDRIVHEPARLAILAVLHSAAEVDFMFLLTATGLSKGNLSKQTSKLEEAGYIAIRKYFKGKIPATAYRMTPAGSAAFATYWERMTAIGQSLQQPGT